MPHLTQPQESASRKLIDNILAERGWITDEYSPDCEVFTERAKTTAQAQKLGGRFPDYLLYESGSNTPVAVLEAKKQGMSLSAALQDAIAKYANPLGVPIVLASDGHSTLTHHIPTDGPLTLDDSPLTSIPDRPTLVRFYHRGPALTLPPNPSLSRRQLMDIFSRANHLLRKEGLREGLERFTEFCNLLFLKLISEIDDQREVSGQRRLLDRRHTWDRFCYRPAEDMLEYINDIVLPRLVNQYNHSGDVISPRLLIQSPNTLKSIIDELSALTLLDADTDIKGDAFEFFLQHSITVGTDLGEYFTPRHIVRLMVDLVHPVYGETIYDPCCGTGGFLIEAFNHILEGVRPSNETLRRLHHDTIFGRELTGTAKLAKMNMILTGDGHTNIEQLDSLSQPVHNKYDVILTNFPFSQSTEHAGLYGLARNDANPVFLMHIINALKDGGRAAVVVPDSLLFNEATQYARTRETLLTTCDVQAIVSLHNYVFRPYAGQTTSILFFTKGRPTSETWYFLVEEDGYEKTASRFGRPAIDEDDLPRLREAWSNRRETESSFSVPRERIEANGNLLSANQYLEDTSSEDAWVELGGPNGLCDITVGATPLTANSEYYGGPHSFVRIGDMKAREVTETAKHITDAGVASKGIPLLPAGTLMFGFKLTIGKTAFAGQPLYTNEAIAGLIPKDDRVLPEFLYYVLPMLDYTPYANATAKGKTLNSRSLPRVRVPLPSIARQKQFVAELQALEDEAEELRRRVESMEQDAGVLTRDILERP